MDQMVLKTQQWLNNTYRDRAGFGSVTEDGATGWNTIYGLIRALQIELGISATANNFGPGTQSRFQNRWPNGISQSASKSNVHAIIQGALWCKGYSAEYGEITTEFTENVANSIRILKSDIGLSDSTATIDLELMMALLSMKQFRLLFMYGGKASIRSIQQTINRDFKAYTGILPTDGLYGREMNTGLIQVLQALEGFSPAQATGNFGDGTRSRLRTINSGSGAWVWLASAALVCNGQSSSVTSTWNDSLAAQVREFQKQYVLPETSAIDPTTWMSLLTSKGDPNRACVACDTRFEITDELAGYLKADGYRIVGRYLSEPGQDELEPKDYFKAIRPGELERIVHHGLQYFPIFQEYSTKLSHFSVDNGHRHAIQAQAVAERLGIPPTIIYFAVDYDATDPEVTSAILPYFKAITQSLGGGYRVGIYASRNICTRISREGYAVASFVSDMSTGFSGNLGFPIPDNWVFDQFHEISGYRGKWDLDRVASSGQIPACSTVRVPSLPGNSDPGDAFSNWMRTVEDIYAGEYVSLVNSQPANSEAGSYALGWLRKPEYWSAGYEKGLMWQTYTPEVDPTPESMLHRAQVERICSEMKIDSRQASSSEDLAHFAASSLGYLAHGTDAALDEYGWGDLGGWALDLVQIWGAYLRSGTTDTMEEWLSRHLGISKDDRGFSAEDLYADADAYLLIHRYWATSARLSDSLRDLRSMPPNARVFEFYQVRFGGSVRNVQKAFWDLISGALGIDLPLVGGPLTRAGNADRLPNKDESDRLAAVFAQKMQKMQKMS